MQLAIYSLVLTILSLVQLSSCGVSSNRVNLDTRIVGGSEINIDEIPYQVALLVILGGRFHLICGGSIIHSSFVLTAAHCTINYKNKPLSIRAGSTYWDKGVRLNVKKIIQHEMFQSDYKKPGFYDYDFSLLMLSGTLRYSKFIRAVKLPRQNQMIPSEASSLVSGWGVRNFGDSEMPNELHAAEVKTIGFTKCKDLYGHQNITDQMFCAGFMKGGVDACIGDSGGPLVSDGTLIGVISWGDDCAKPNYPGVYADVSTVRTWIDEIIQMEYLKYLIGLLQIKRNY